MDKKKLTTGGSSTGKETINEFSNSFIGVAAYPSEPYVDTSSTRPIIHKFRLIWLADNIDELKENFHQSFAYLRRIAHSIDTFSDANRCVDFLTEISYEKVFLVISGALGQNII